ncbi:MAG: pentapeptide repeat-containing protein [Actinobacteria bacterium]|nr:MAG: pentapeptide repeat-containing protein [Actinomycetota bacterium]
MSSIYEWGFEWRHTSFLLFLLAVSGISPGPTPMPDARTSRRRTIERKGSVLDPHRPGEAGYSLTRLPRLYIITDRREVRGCREAREVANEEHLKILGRGVRAWNEWRRENIYEMPDLYGADLRGLDLTYIHLMRANLGECDLTGANLRKSFLVGAFMHGMILVDSNLEGADMRGCHLSEAKLAGAKMAGAVLNKALAIGVDFSGCDMESVMMLGTNLENSDFTGAVMTDVDLTDANLSGIITEGVKGYRFRKV